MLSFKRRPPLPDSWLPASTNNLPRLLVSGRCGGKDESISDGKVRTDWRLNLLICWFWRLAVDVVLIGWHTALRTRHKSGRVFSLRPEFSKSIYWSVSVVDDLYSNTVHILYSMYILYTRPLSNCLTEKHRTKRDNLQQNCAEFLGWMKIKNAGQYGANFYERYS